MTASSPVPANALQHKQTIPFTALCIATRATLRTISQFPQTIPPLLYAEVARLNLAIAGPIQWIYTDATGDETKEFGLEIALPIQQIGEQPEGAAYKTFAAFDCLSYTHHGSWAEFGAVYNALFGQIYQQGFRTNQRVREVYSTIDLEAPENCVTEIQIGLAS